jgi:hypothetical protein
MVNEERNVTECRNDDDRVAVEMQAMMMSELASAAPSCCMEHRLMALTMMAAMAYMSHDDYLTDMAKVEEAKIKITADLDRMRGWIEENYHRYQLKKARKELVDRVTESGKPVWVI